MEIDEFPKTVKLENIQVSYAGKPDEEMGADIYICFLYEDNYKRGCLFIDNQNYTSPDAIGWFGDKGDCFHSFKEMIICLLETALYGNDLSQNAQFLAKIAANIQYPSAEYDILSTAAVLIEEGRQKIPAKDCMTRVINFIRRNLHE